MKHPWPILLWLFGTIACACNPKVESAQITGGINISIKSPLIIDGEHVEASEGGAFNYERVVERTQLLDVSCGGLEWTVFLMPGSQMELLIKDQNPDSIEYKGDFQSSNVYLLSTQGIGKEIDQFFNENWMGIHELEQAAYVATIDSLKSIYLGHLDKGVGAHRLSKKFVETWTTEINYSFNTLILRYPERFLQFPPAAIELSKETWEYLQTTDVDRPDYSDLPGCINYTRAWIELHVDQLTRNEISQRHYDLRKMDHIFPFIDRSFETQELKDHWKSIFLKEHIEKQGYANVHPYLDQYYETVETTDEKEIIDHTIQSIVESREDHEVKIYKTENGFNLEAHVFQTQTPAQEGSPAIVIFHGGGWNGGSPSWGFSRARHFAEHGMVAVAAQYRLTNENDITAVESMADARDLIIWMRQNADSLHLDPNQITGYGWSAGAHLISSAAIFPETEALTRFSSIPDALALVSPAVSLPKGEGWKYWTFNVLGNKARVEDVNPVEHIRSGLPPTIIVQGRDDTVTPLEGVENFKNEMLDFGNICELYVYDGVGHLFTPSYMPDNGWPRPDQEIQKQAFSQVDQFLKELGYLE